MALRDVRKRLKLKGDRIADTLDEFKPPGFQGVGLWQVSKFFLHGLTDRRFSLTAMGMAYRFMFALFPALILIFTTVPKSFHQEILSFFNEVVPSQAFYVVGNVVDEFFDKPGFGLISLNFLVMLYSALAGIKAMMYAFSRSDAAFHKRNFFQINAIALLIFIVLIVLFLFMLAVLVFAEYFFLLDDNGVARTDWIATAFRVGYWIVIFGGIQVGVSVLYYLGPETRDRWAFFSPGSLLSGLLCLGAILAFRAFVGQFANFNKIYGSISALMVLMFWFYWLSVVLLIGFELNRAIDRAKAQGQEELVEDENGENSEAPTVPDED